MWITIGCYLLIFLAVVGCATAAARAARELEPARPAAEPEPSVLIAEEWDAVRRDHCLPTGCPRVIGRPPHPPKDSTCEECAALFLDRRWRQLMGDLPSRRGARRSDGPGAERPLRVLDLRSDLATRAEEPEARARPGHSGPIPARRRWAGLLYGVGALLLAAGCGTLLAAGMDWRLILLAWLLVFAGTASLIAAGRSTPA